MTQAEGTEAGYQQLAGNMFVYGSVALALAMAKEKGIVTVLCQAEEPLFSSDIATQAKLKERYVREVLNGLTVAGFVRLEEGTGGKDGREARYWVPQACRSTLHKASITSCIISACVKRYSDVMNCFDLDGPNCIRYDSISFEAIDGLSMIAKDYLTEAMLETPGLKQGLERGIEVAEAGCGTGQLLCHLAAMFPNSHFTATDIVAEPMEYPRQKVQQLGLTNVTFKVVDVCQVPDELEGKFDWMWVRDVIHDLPHPLKALQGIKKALKPGGHFSLVDKFVSTYVAENVATHREAAALYSLGTFLCIPESYQQEDSEALGPCWGTERATELANEAGLKVLGLIKRPHMGTDGLLMCQNPDNGQ